MQVQVFFAQQRLKELAEQYPTLGERQPFKVLGARPQDDP